ncbi:MAG: DUF2004 domain-containing protein [Verrucomicrobiota bacterium]
MSLNETEIQRRTKIARDAIRAAYGTEEDEYGATLFVSYHLEEVESSYWKERYQTDSPEPFQILDSLVLKSDFEDEEDLDSFDFTLPGNATNYLICVTFDENGEVEDISTES